MTVEAIEEIQIKNPSQKFQAKLIEKEKQMERAMVENRVKQLEREERKAQKNLAKTMHSLGLRPGRSQKEGRFR